MNVAQSDEEFDRLRRRVLWSMPTGLYLIGSAGEVGGIRRWNLMTANLVVQVATSPKLLAVAVDEEALTRRLIEDGRSFSVCLLERADRSVVRRFVKPVSPEAVVLGDDGRPVRLNGEEVLVAPSGAPVLARAAGWLDCALGQALELGSHRLFLGEVVAAGSAGEDGEILRMEDTRMHYGG